MICCRLPLEAAGPHRARGRVGVLKQVGLNDYVLAIKDRRDGRTHLLWTPRELEAWLKSFEAGECLEPTVELCGRCDGIHSPRDVDGEMFANCIACQAELVEVVLELRDEQEADG